MKRVTQRIEKLEARLSAGTGTEEDQRLLEMLRLGRLRASEAQASEQTARERGEAVEAEPKVSEDTLRSQKLARHRLLQALTGYQLGVGGPE